MLFGFDINPKCVEMTRVLLAGGKKYKVNVECKDMMNADLSRFKVVIANPPYDKQEGMTEPLYYPFVRSFSTMKKDSNASFIIPSGWLVGPKAASFRNFVFNNFNITHMRYVTNETFKLHDENNKILQPTVVITATTGSPTEEFVFQRFANGEEINTVVNRSKDIYPLGMPLYIGEESKTLIRIAMTRKKFETETGGTEQVCVHLGPANMSGYYLSSMPISWYVDKIIYAIEAAEGCKNKDRVFNKCESMEDAEKLKAWLLSAGARLIMAMWSTTYRNIRSNIGQVPALITTGDYSHEAAYAQLGLTSTTIEWLKQFDKENNSNT